MGVPQSIVGSADRLAALDVLGQTVLFNPPAWRTKLGDDPDLVWINERYAGSITRADTLALAGVARDLVSVRRAFLAAMVWGYGRMGYGPHRVSRMVAAADHAQRVFDGVALVRHGELERAYLHFGPGGVGAVPMLGPSFITKLFYVFGAAEQGTTRPLLGQEGGCASPMPLIFDERVMVSLDRVGVDDAGVREMLAEWRSGSVRRNASAYVRYVEMANRWAQELGVRPDAVEMLLFLGLEQHHP